MKIRQEQLSNFFEMKSLGLHYANRRVGQEFLNWLSEEFGWNGSDPDLFYETDDNIAWNKIFERYVVS